MGVILANPQHAAAQGSSARRVWNAPAPLRLWHLASLDAPTVAVTWAWSFAWSAHAHVPAWNLVLLGLIVWAIYIGDRLLDARTGRRNPSRHLLQERHYFHWRNRHILVPVAVAAAFTAIWLVGSRLNGMAIRKDSLVAVAALAYFSGVHTDSNRRGWLKRLAGRLVSREFIVGIIFSAGCLLPVFSLRAAQRLNGRTEAALLCTGMFFAMLAWLNVRAIGCWESFAISRRAVRMPAVFVSTAGLVLALIFLSISLRIAALVIAGAASALLLGLLDLRRSHLTPLALRIAADAVLLTPIVLVLSWRAAA